MALLRVTQGEDQWVPISGCYMARLMGQVTCLSSLACGAARSEPSGPPRRGARAGSGSSRRGGGWRVPGDVPRVQGAMVDP